jgi:anti-sigma factor ChrR (cupin superfamily)
LADGGLIYFIMHLTTTTTSQQQQQPPGTVQRAAPVASHAPRPTELILTIIVAWLLASSS